MMTKQRTRVGGVDSHQDTINVAVISDLGQPVGDREFPTTVAGYRRAVAWLIEHGPIQAVGIEGTSSYGVGITTAVLAAGIRVVEVNRTRPAERRRQGKTDALDAYRAARSVVSGEAHTEPKRASIEPLRALTIARRSAVKAQQAAWRQITALLVNAPAQLRDRCRDLPAARLIATLASTRPDQLADPDQGETMYALRSLARRHAGLGTEIGTFQRAEDGLEGPPLGQVGLAVGAGRRVVGHADFDDVVQCGVGVAVPAPAQAVALDASGADRDWRCAAQRRERCRGSEPVGIIPGGDQQLRADDRADAFDGHQGGVGCGGAGQHPLLEVGVAREIFHVPGRSLRRTRLLRPSTRTKGHRQANAALYRIVLCRLRWDERTRTYMQRRTAEGLSKKEIIRCLKRLIAREIYFVLTAKRATAALPAA